MNTEELIENYGNGVTVRDMNVINAPQERGTSKKRANSNREMTKSFHTLKKGFI